ncbi:MAG: hypothetical protein ACREFL_06910 [Stellaceae bacterium]
MARVPMIKPWIFELFGSPVPDAPGQSHGFTVGLDEFIAGTGAQVAEQIIAQCRKLGCGNFLSTMSRNRDRDNQIASYEIYAREVIPRLRRAAVD